MFKGWGSDRLPQPIPTMQIDDTPQASPDEARKLWGVAENALPAEKANIEARGKVIGSKLHQEGSLRIDGVGQKVAEIPLALYVRLEQQFPGCMRDKEFVDALLADNPQFRAQGYRPKQHSLRHAFDMGRANK